MAVAVRKLLDRADGGGRFHPEGRLHMAWAGEGLWKQEKMSLQESMLQAPERPLCSADSLCALLHVCISSLLI